MHVRRTKQRLQAAGIGLYVLSVLSLVWAFLWPCTITQNSVAVTNTQPSRRHEQINSAALAAQMESWSTKQLRAPLLDPRAMAPTAPVVDHPPGERTVPLNIVLLGT